MSKVITGVVRFSYAHVFEPYAGDGEETAKYSVQLIIPKSDKKTIKAIQSAVQDALIAGKDKKFGGKIPKVFKDPLRDGDDEREDDSNYADAYFLTAKSTTAPDVVDRSRSPILDKDEFYSGCFGVASITFFPFNVKNAGIGVALNNIMKTHEGDSLGGKRSNADEDFANISTDDFDDLD